MHHNKRTLILWDLGNTLIKTNAYGFIKETGLTNFFLYPLLEWQHPKTIHEHILQILSRLTQVEHEECQGRLQQYPMPAIVCSWLAGIIDHTTIKQKAHMELEADCFLSKRQRKLISAALDALFNPDLLAHCSRPIIDGSTLVKTCIEKKKSRIQHAIFSNWDAVSFERLKRVNSVKPIFKLFNDNDMIISGMIGTAKPHTAMFQYAFTAYDIEPSNCILIDDQYENIDAAIKLGMTGIHVHNNNYRSIAEQLINHGIL